MPNVINANGITVMTYQEYVDYFTTKYREIYGTDINLDQDTPDGQMMNIFIQALVDQGDMAVQVFNSFNPDFAIGKVLDQRVSINGIQRQAGTYTITPITIVTSLGVNLFGVDQSVEQVFVVADNAGNEWKLIDSVSYPVPGTYVTNFRSAVPGKSLTIPNTIQTAITIVLGVETVNNPSSAISIGITEETDYELSIRRQKSVALSSQGYREALEAALENVSGVTYAKVHENKGDSVNPDGQPGHSLWAILSGTYEDDHVARAIYNYRNAGCGMFGMISYILTQKDGSPFEVLWDNVETETVFIKFKVTPLDGIIPVNVDLIRTELPEVFIPGIYQQLNINNLATAIRTIDSNALVEEAGFSLSDTGPWTPTILPSSKNKQFIVTAPNIIITPLQIKPVDPQILVDELRQFVAYGGFGSYTFTLTVNNSGATISPTGTYTAGPTPGSDVVQVVDTKGNTATSAVTVL
jgi:hypothetical protein